MSIFSRVRRKRAKRVHGMNPIQIRLNKELVDKIDKLVKEGVYPNRSEAIRDAVRRLTLKRMIK